MNLPSCGKRGSAAHRLTGSVALLTAILASLAQAQTQPLNDTGQTRCVSAGTWVACTAAVTGPGVASPNAPGQDARFGRDAAASAGRLGKTGGGIGGFDFTRLCMNGEAAGSGSCPTQPLANSGASPAATEWACTRDNVTGLVWSLQTQAADWASASAAGYADSHNRLRRCGHASGWRLPSMRELESLVHFDRSNPALDLDFFPDTDSGAYWSSEVSADNAGFAWFINFADGVASVDSKTSTDAVRLVFGPAGSAPAALSVNAAGSVSDSSSLLVWDRCVWGQSGTACADGAAVTLSWAEALATADRANASAYKGSTDWRVPNAAELRSLVQRGRVNPALDPAAFPNAPADWVWSSTSAVADPASAWKVYFYDGLTSGHVKTDAYLLRLVRGGQPWAFFDGLSAASGSTDTTPDAFSFAAVTDAAPDTEVVSEPITVQGINAPATITLSGGEYSVNGASFVTTCTFSVACNGFTVNLASRVRVRVKAASGYGTSVRARLSIGGVSADFVVTTRSARLVDNASEVFVDPQNSVVGAGVVLITQAPSDTLQLAANAPDNAIVSLDIDIDDAVRVSNGRDTLTYTRQSSDATSLQVQTVNGNKLLALAQGRVSIAASASGSTIPVVSSSRGTALLTTGVTDAVVNASLDAQRNVVVAVPAGASASRVEGNGALTYTSSAAAGGKLPRVFSVFPGEAVHTDSGGAPVQLRLGSAGQNSGQPGDYLGALPHAVSGLNVPLVGGVLARFGNEALVKRLARALAAFYGLSTGLDNASLTQDSSTGVLNLSLGSKHYRLLPIGALHLDPGTATRAVDASQTGSNLLSVTGESLSLTLAPATAYDDLLGALQAIDASATLDILSDGVVRARAAGSVFAAQPAAELVPGGLLSAGFDEVGGQLAVRDVLGNRQVLYPAFADTDFVSAIFREALPMPSLSISNSGLGVYQTNLGAPAYLLAPAIVLGTPPAEQAGNLWWIDASGMLNVRYSDGSAQAFGVY